MTDASGLEAVRVLLSATHALNENHSVERLKAVQELLNRTSCLRQDYQKRSCDEAPDHNVFRLLGIQRSEVGLHSRLLADLLDPFGSHGQGGLFLHRFLTMLARFDEKFVTFCDQLVTHPLSEDWRIGRERDRIDISVSNRRLGLLMFIENKIDAAEQHDQLTRYRRRLEQSGYPHQFLLYLRPRSKGPPTTGMPDICLTYEQDIINWLRCCEPDVRPKHLRENIRQYIDVVCNLGG